MNPTAPFSLNKKREIKNLKKNINQESPNILEKYIKLDPSSIIYEILNKTTNKKEIIQYYNQFIIDFQNFNKNINNKLKQENIYLKEKENYEIILLKLLDIFKTFHYYLKILKNMPSIKSENMETVLIFQKNKDLSLKEKEILNNIEELLTKRIKKIPKLKKQFLNINNNHKIIENNISFILNSAIYQKNIETLEPITQKIYKNIETLSIKNNIDITNIIEENSPKLKELKPVPMSMSGPSL